MEVNQSGAIKLLVRYAAIKNLHARNPKIREKVVGATQISDVPSRFWELSALHDLGIGFETWQSLSLYERGELLAYYELKSMIDFIEHHDYINKIEQEAANRQAKGGGSG